MAIAVDPRDDATLLAGSNDLDRDTMRTYYSRDSGRSWTTTTDPPLPTARNRCASDPAVGIDGRGRQYFAFIVFDSCDRTGRSSMFIATRSRADQPWRTRARPVAPLEADASDDRPALAIDLSRQSPNSGRLYVAWTRAGRRRSVILLSHSDTEGADWSHAVRVNSLDEFPLGVSLAIARDGTVYAAWMDLAQSALYLNASRDGGLTFRGDHVITPIYGPVRDFCKAFPGIRIPAQPHRCVDPNPTVSVDNSEGPRAGRVYITYANTNTENDSQDIFVSAFSPSLTQILGLLPHRVGSRDGTRVSDQFLPASATDPSSGRLWACFYETSGRRRVDATYSCSSSVDGGQTWTRTIRAASRQSNETVPEADTFEYGDYTGLAVAHGVAHPIWTDSRRLSQLAEEIFTTRLTAADFVQEPR